MFHTRNYWMAALCGAVVVCIALLETSGSTARAVPPPNPSQSPFEGAWAGTFTTSVGGFGDLEYDISRNGKIRGYVVNLANGVAGELVGHVNNNGFGHVNLLNPPNVTIQYHIWVTIDDDGNLVGTAEALGNLGFTVEFTLSPV